MRFRILLLPLVLAACGEDGPDPEIARLRGQLEELKREFSDFRIAKEREIQQLKAELAAKEKAGDLASRAEEVQARFDAYREKAETEFKALQSDVAGMAREAAEAAARFADTEKLRQGLARELADTKGLLDGRNAELEAMKAELAKFKKLLGR